MNTKYQLGLLTTISLTAVCLVGWTQFDAAYIRLHNAMTSIWLPKFMSSKGIKPEPCTFKLISKHLQVHHKFTNSGKWFGYNHQNISRTTRGFFDPEICHLEKKQDNTSWLSACLQETGTRNIVFLGDSNSRFHTNAFLAMLEDRENFKCRDVLHDKGRNAEGYLEIKKVDTMCDWANERQFFCSRIIGNGSSLALNITVHYVKMLWVRENSSFVSESKAVCPQVTKSVGTIQEYILGEFAQRTQPDLIILGSTAHTRNVAVKQWTEDQKWLKDKVDRLLPKSTTVIWMTPMSWRVDRLPHGDPNYVNEVKDNGEAFTINQQIYRQNLQLYKLLESTFNDGHSKILPFFDIYNMSSLVQKEWYTDWIHCNRYFYSGLQDALFETFCNSFVNHQV